VSARGPRARRRGVRGATLLLALALAACGRAASAGSDRLAIEAPRWWFSRVPVRITAVAKGALAESRASFAVAVELNESGRFEMTGERTAISIPGSFFSAGWNEIAVKTGTERATARVRIVPIAWLVAPSLFVAAFVAALILRRRKAS
jgi:hypothetical protein